MKDNTKEKLKQWLGENNQIGMDIWEKKYRYNNESFDEWLDRVSGGDAKLRQLISERKFLFGGRALANRGTNTTTKHHTLSNGAVLNCGADIEYYVPCDNHDDETNDNKETE